MDKEDILKLSGQELTKTVAESFMEWSFREMDNGFGYPANFWVDGNGVKVKPVNFWSPSSNIQDALSVLERLQEYGGCDIGCYGNKHYREYRIQVHNAAGYMVEIVGEKMPELICKAALIAVL